MWKYILIFLLLILGGAGVFGFQKYNEIFKPNVPANLTRNILEIPSNSSFDDIVNLLLDKGFLINETSFRWLADIMKYKSDEMRVGRFEIEPNWSNRKLIQHLRNGKQATVKLVLNNERLPTDVAGKAASFIEADSTQIISLFRQKDFLHKHGLAPEELMTVFIPNTYDFYWNTSAEQFFEKMLKEHEKFWSKDGRRGKAEAMDMTEKEVYTLASIVERETLKNDEKKRIAGVYLNRLQRGILLQADPTVVFANGDFGIRRVLNKHLEFDSPYNTYMYAGLPPGPISMASIASLDAVLNAEKHKFLYFCAKPDNSGYHAFAKNLKGHNVNANKYRSWLNKQRRLSRNR